MVRCQIHTAGKRNKGLGNGNGCIIKDPETKATQFNKTGIRDKVQLILKGKSVEKWKLKKRGKGKIKIKIKKYKQTELKRG